MPKPKILLVDDESTERPQRLLAEVLKASAAVQVRSPEELTKETLSQAELILLDFNLGEWEELAGVPIARKPINGLALAAVLRAHIGDRGLKSNRATAFALRSGYLQELVGDTAGSRAVHLLARLNNLEWVFAKGTTSSELQIVALASAVNALRKGWRKREHTFRGAMEALLKLPREPWATTSREDVDSCQPPIDELSGTSHGIPFLRWLLHRILPYPCFLWSETRLANRLRLSEEQLAALLARRTSLAMKLRTARYKGLLADFAGPRWWSAGIESALWSLTDGRPHDAAHLARLTRQQEPAMGEELDSVLCVDGDIRVMSDVVPSRLAVRVMPDDWPPFAEQPWARIGLIDEAPHMRAIVHKADLPRLKGSV
jgi:hypothetical protein